MEMETTKAKELMEEEKNNDSVDTTSAVEEVTKEVFFPTNNKVVEAENAEVLLDSVASDCLGINGYEKLPRSLSLKEEKGSSSASPETSAANKKVFFPGLLDFNKKQKGVVKEGDDGMEVVNESEKKKKKRSSWLPDPHKRWPIQGWY